MHAYISLVASEKEFDLRMRSNSVDSSANIVKWFRKLKLKVKNINTAKKFQQIYLFWQKAMVTRLVEAVVEIKHLIFFGECV